MKNIIVSSLVQQLEEAYHKQAWHGTNLRGSLRGLTLEQLCWRPTPKRHNIWEIAIHCAYWKYAVKRRITNEQRGAFLLKGSNWFTRPTEKTLAAWKKDLQLLEETHENLIEVACKLSDKELSHRVATKKFTHLQTIQGIALHDIYHAGQIQLLKRLQKKS